MKRLATYTALALTTVTMLACGGGSAPPSGVTPAPAPTAAPVADDDGPQADSTDKKITLWMSRNQGNLGSSVDAACVGATSLRPKAQRKQKVRFYVRQDDEQCPGLDTTKVELRFDTAIWVDPTEIDDARPMLPPVATLTRTGLGRQIVGRVYHDMNDSTPTVPNGPYKFYVWYNGKKASPDPEVDVDGNCGTDCGPMAP